MKINNDATCSFVFGLAAKYKQANTHFNIGDTMPYQTLTINTSGAGLYEFTDEVQDFLAAHRSEDALLTVFVRHTSCSLIIQENADLDVQRDMNAFFKRLVPASNDPSMDYIIHTSEGPDDMPAHIKAALTQTSIGIPVIDGRMVLGTWQGIYLFEHRVRAHRRQIVLHLK
jgi:secondary thiamine-phosphate synthase enzyme